MGTRYVTVRLTEREAEALLTMAASGDYHHDGGDWPEIERPATRAERKIRRALMALPPRPSTGPDGPVVVSV